jgi:predicted GH43/DUF377 family glycosyl hydrolase
LNCEINKWYRAADFVSEFKGSIDEMGQEDPRILEIGPTYEKKHQEDVAA